MTHDLEEALRGALKTAAQHAPPPRQDLLHRVARRHRTRRRNRAALAAATMLVVLAGSGVIAATIGAAEDPVHPSIHPSAAALPAVRPARPVAVERLWPEAVRSVPERLPNGRKFHPITLLDAETVLVSTESSFEKADQLLTYRIPTRQMMSVTSIVTPADATTFASDFTAGDGHVAWWLARKAKGGVTMEVWAAPLAGGGPRKVSAIAAGADDDTGLSRLAIAGDQVIWSQTQPASGEPDAIYQAPLSGGPGRKVAGTDGYQLVAWPWIGRPAADRTGDRRGQVIFKSLLNAQTGERRTASISDSAAAWRCGLTWCIGDTTAGTATLQSPTSLVQRRDGRGGRTLPDTGVGGTPDELPAYDRFMTYVGPVNGARSDVQGLMLYDLNTGKVADLGSRSSNQQGLAFMTITDPANRLYVVERKDSYTLIDLASVP